LGVGNDATWTGLIEGRSGIGPITRFDASSFPCRIAGEVPDFDPTAFVSRKDQKKMDAFIHYAVAAAGFALEDAGLAVNADNAERVGVFIGSGIGGLPSIERQHRIFLEHGVRKISPFFIPGLIVNLAAGQVSIRFGAKGPNSAVATACTTGTHAIGDAFRLIQHGYADAMIAGGAESVITPLAVGGFCAMRALSSHRNDAPAAASRPFDLERDGFVMGEGAGIVVLESAENAQSRSASPYCEIVGYGMSGDAHHVSAPSPDGDGPIRVMRATLADAGVEPSAVDYINAHGTSTPAGDRVETLAIKKVFGDHAARLAISSTKSMTGHLLGAAGGLETAIMARSIRDGRVPPTINLDTPDPDCDLDYVADGTRALDVRHALNNGFGFGGTNGALLLRKLDA
ncbi:MAG: beta-ketoacyl-ACP synthase II, partial [Acidobacteriota bacterium]